MKYKYLLWEALFSLCMIVGVVILIFYMHNLLITCVALLGMSWFLFKFILGIRLIIDMVSGPCEADTIFTGVFNIERLDIFFSIRYQNIYLNDEKLKKILCFFTIYMMFFKMSYIRETG